MSGIRDRFERTQPTEPAQATEPVTTEEPIVAPVAPPMSTLSQDPDVLLEQDTAPAAPVEVPVEVPPPAPVMKRVEYQPKDEHGRPMGGVQVIEYTDEDDLKKKWAEKEEKLVRRLREVTRKQKLGIDDTPAPPDSQPFDTAVELEEKPLKPEEIFDLTQKLNDPATFVEARDRLLESAMGVSPAEFRKRYNEQQQLTLQLLVKSNYDIFEKQHAGDFLPSADNKQILTDWMSKKGLAPTVANFEFALSTLKESGLILEAPTVREVAPTPAPTPAAPAPVAEVPPAPPVAPVSTEPKPVVPAVNDSRIAETKPPAATRQPVRVPSGLNNGNTSVSGVSSARTSLTVAEFEAIPADELKKRLKDPVFAKQVNDLFSKKPVQSQV